MASPPLPEPPPASGEPKTRPVPPGHWWRIHPGSFAPEAFNASGLGNARFSPLFESAPPVPVPTMYAAATLDGAIMETLLHNVPTPSEGFIYDLQADIDRGIVASQISVTVELQLVDMTSVGLQNMGMLQSQMFETEQGDYERTRRWAAWLRREQPLAQGLAWMSRRDNSAMAVVLFEDRIGSGVVVPGARTRLPIGDPFVLDRVLSLMDRLGLGDAGP
jgi:hypothetical protein